MAKRRTSGIDTTSATGIANASALSGLPSPTNTALADRAAGNTGVLAKPVGPAFTMGEDQFTRGQMGLNNAIAAKLAAANAGTGIGQGGDGGTGSGGTGGADNTKNDGTGAGANGGTNALSQWSPEGDPTYMMAMQGAQSSFNTAKANALMKMQAQQNALQNQILSMNQNAPDQNRALADSYAVRGMQRGDYGAYYRAQDKQNAALITAQTDIKDQVASLNQDFLSNYGTVGGDWLGTAQGQAARTSAMQLAIQNRLTQAGVQ